MSFTLPPIHPVEILRLLAERYRRGAMRSISVGLNAEALAYRRAAEECEALADRLPHAESAVPRLRGKP